MKTINLITVGALDLSVIEGLAVELATVGGCEIVAACGTTSTARYPAPEIRPITWPVKGTVMIAIDLTRRSMVCCLASAPAGPEQEVPVTQHEVAAPVPNMSHSPDRHVVTVEVTVHAWTADEAAQVERAFVTEVFAQSEYKLGNVHAINAEPPGDETWHRALD